MLTDAHPGDDLGMVREGVPVAADYMGGAAIRDAAACALALRKRGVHLVGLVESVFGTGETDGAARGIFGSHFVRVHGPEELAKKAGRVLAQEIAQR